MDSAVPLSCPHLGDGLWRSFERDRRWSRGGESVHAPSESHRRRTFESSRWTRTRPFRIVSVRSIAGCESSRWVIRGRFESSHHGRRPQVARRFTTNRSSPQRDDSPRPLKMSPRDDSPRATVHCNETIRKYWRMSRRDDSEVLRRPTGHRLQKPGKSAPQVVGRSGAITRSAPGARRLRSLGERRSRSPRGHRSRNARSHPSKIVSRVRRLH